MKDSEQQPSVDNEFDGAKVIVETLKGLDKDKQERAIRFASETLGLRTPADPPGPHTPPPVGLDQPPPKVTNAVPLARVVDIKQFTAAKAPKTDQQFAVVVAYYYRFEAPDGERKEVIGAKDIKEAVRLVGGRKEPKDAGMTLVNAKNSGYLDAAARGKFRINAVGENFVAMTLPGKHQSTPSVRRAGKTAKNGGKAPAKRRTKARK
jgi:hypothetical protein